MTKSLTVISHECCALHEMTPGHPESPMRVNIIDQAISQSQILSDVQSIEAIAATEEQLLLAHDPYYIHNLQDNLPYEGLKSLDPDTHMNAYSWDAALFAAGSGIQAVDKVMATSNQIAFCNVRPPGHHAEYDKAMGFCFFNSIVIAARHAVKKYGLSRVAIVDFDVHHGNGTQDILQYDEEISYISTFQHPFYPDCEIEYVADNIYNIPVPAYTTGDSFQAIFKEKCLQVLDELKPELLLISAGFDAHYKDPLADLLLTEYDYFYLSKQLTEIADRYSNGRVISMLEGGYSIQHLAQSVLAHLCGLLDYSLSDCIKQLTENQHYPWIFEQWIALKNHRNILIRPLCDNDEEKLREFSQLLTQQDLSSRFFGSSTNLKETFIKRLLSVDYDSRIALLACSQTELHQEMIVGTVELVIDQETQSAEFAIITRSDLKGQGIGYNLMQKAIAYCRDRGLTELHGEVMLDNTNMLSLVTELGFLKQEDYGDKTVYVKLAIT